MNTDAITATTTDCDLVIHEFDRPSTLALDFLAFSVHTSGPTAAAPALAV
ncbi:hypothetical protein GCM10022243_14740 [Saccharothrix violaceirubra]|uniref:Uncharacterized protein n=1 Tax=Saccharothrix violaceirubra TaxID=413306 RepID=A0A7W7T694_9PSEU|nr:hypothetical protein [Saccharothrix violaceirubra]MBB4967348.1 hypothetical protein [Saccharothrix violaceirubra]